MVSGTEAPAEMTIYFPQFKALDSAEIACPLLHNILTLRGAQVRDAKKWATSLNEADRVVRRQDRRGPGPAQLAELGQENVVAFLANQRDLYEYLHDQTLRLTNHGYTGTEIAEMLKLPSQPGSAMVHPRLLRHLEPQCQGDLPEVHRLVRWQPGQPACVASD